MKDILVRTTDRRLAAKAVEAGVVRFLLDKPLSEIGRIDALRLEGSEIHRDGRRIGDYVRLESREDELRVRAMKGKRELVVVDARDWKVIPFENLIAALEGRTKLYAVARTPAEAELFLATLEKGVDGIVVEPKNAHDLLAFVNLVRGTARKPIPLSVATITRIEPAGVGERVCIDTTSMFEPGEGMLIGSASHGFFLVAAECYETEYVAARPFRVNAGAVHSYVLSGETTKYLSELRSGVRVEAVKPDGSRREVVVGRAKIETRPMLLIEADADGTRIGAILQNAETIRLVGPRGKAKSVSQLRVGDKVLVRRESGARHFGMKVQERIREQ
jgi:3-dehydroquinate synthase II